MYIVQSDHYGRWLARISNMSYFFLFYYDDFK